MNARAFSIGSFVGIAALLLLGGCWVDEESVHHPIWSDDDEMIAFSLARYEIRASDVGERSSDTRSRHHTYQIYVVPSDLSESPEAMGGRAEILADYYLMSGAGYLLVTADDGTHQHFLDGDSRRIFGAEDLHALTQDEDDRRSYEVIPSPSGDLLAIHQHEGFDTIRSAIVVLDAFSLERLFVDEHLPDGVAVWNPQGDLLFLSGEIDGALSFRSGSSDWVPIAEPGCEWPPTTSSPVAEDGRIIGPGTSLEDPIEFDASLGESVGRPNVPFGCP